MDNAAKGLIVAGGILLAIMTLTIFMYGLSATSRINMAQDEADELQALQNFNLQYEAYNKKRMYGVDVITVINKAIQNNRNMDALTDPEDKHYVNVIVITNQEYKNELEVRTFDETTSSQNSEYNNNIAIPTDTGDGKFNLIRKRIKENNTSVIKPGEPNELLELHGRGDLEISKDFTKKFVDNADDIEKQTYDSVNKIRYTYVLHSALTNFKKAIFECPSTYNGDPNPRYNDEGRIDRIVFSQRSER